MPNSNFGTHGQITLKRQGQILIVEATGPGNIELVAQYDAQFSDYLTPLSESGLWGTLVLLKGIPLIPPDATELLKQGTIQRKALGLKASAVVVGDSEYPQSAMSFWQSVYEDTEVSYQCFETESEATKWLLTQINNENC